MKKLMSASIAAATIATAGISAPAAAELSANAGFVTDYYFRGANLGNAGAYAGLDYDISGFYVGVWAIDDGGTAATTTGNTVTGVTAGNDGLEIDYYLGYGGEAGEFSYNVGYTQYTYTYTANYEEELNLGFSVVGFGFDLAVGTAHDPKNGGSAGDTETPYTHIALSYEIDSYGILLGHNITDDSETNGTTNKGTDTDRTYLELSAGGEVAGLDMGVTLGKEIDKNTNGKENDNSDYYLVLDVSKSFTLL